FFYGSSTDPSFGTYIVDLVAQETVLSGGESFATSNTYNAANGFKTSQTVYGITTSFAPDAFGNVRSSTDANANTTQHTHDQGGPQTPTTREPPIPRSITPDGTVATETRRGLTTRFFYDALSRIVRSQPPVGNQVFTEYDNVNGRFTRVRRGPS